MADDSVIHIGIIMKGVGTSHSKAHNLKYQFVTVNNKEKIRPYPHFSYIRLYMLIHFKPSSFRFRSLN